MGLAVDIMRMTLRGDVVVAATGAARAATECETKAKPRTVEAQVKAIKVCASFMVVSVSELCVFLLIRDEFMIQMKVATDVQPNEGER